MTPFYTSLSIWVGALLLVSLSVDNKHEALEDELTKRQIYLGKGAFFYNDGYHSSIDCNDW